MTSIKYVTDQAYKKGRDSVYRDIKDQFAMAALQFIGMTIPPSRIDGKGKEIAKQAYELADLMMKEREK